MAGRNSGKVGGFATIQEIRNAKKQAEANKKRDAEKRRKSLNKSKKKPKK